MERAKIFISDEGYGPIVRQSAIVEEFNKRFPNLSFDIQTDGHIDTLKKIIPQVNHIRKFNNIVWYKNYDGSPNLSKIKQMLSNYDKQSREFIKDETETNFDFVITDFVYEAFRIYHPKNIPVFGVAHFTWDWFFCKLFPPVINNHKLINSWISSAKKSPALFFPPFTPIEILKCYKRNAIEIPLIVRAKKIVNLKSNSKNPKILIIDSGSKVNHRIMTKIISQLPEIRHFSFYLLESDYKVEGDNVTIIPKNDLLSDYIPYMDLVIGRAGFNTISECIASRIPMILFSEHMNPEMNENVLNINGIGFGSFIKLNLLENNIGNVLNDFFNGEYQSIKNNLNNHEIKTNGAEVVVDYISNYLK